MRPRIPTPELSRSLLLEENAPDAWVFLHYEDDGRVVALTPEEYEVLYRPSPEDQL